MKNTWRYIIGDIHGCYEEFLKLENKIKNHAKKNKRKALIISVGDIVDRGPFSKQLLDHFIEGRKYGTHDAVMGNHEAMMLGSLKHFNPGIFKGLKRKYPSWLYTYKERFFDRTLENKLTWENYAKLLKSLWFNQGGKETLLSYGIDSNNPKDWLLPKSHLNFLLSLKPLLFLGKVLVTHALPQLEFVEEVQMTLGTKKKVTSDVKKAAYSLFWNRDIKGVKKLPGKVLVSGHTPLTSVKRHKREGVIQIDTGCYLGRRLTAWCPEKDKIFFVRAQKRYF